MSSMTVQEIYTKTIRPLPDNEKLEIATIILEEVTKKDKAAKHKQKGGDITKFFGMHKGGDPNGSNNEKIDADLARAYADAHEDED